MIDRLFIIINIINAHLLFYNILTKLNQHLSNLLKFCIIIYIFWNRLIRIRDQKRTENLQKMLIEATDD